MGVAGLQLAALAILAAAADDFEPCEAEVCATRPARADAIPFGGPGALLSWAVEPHLASRRIAGVVLANGRPAADAIVELRFALPAEAQGLPLAVATDGAGQFDFGVQPTGLYLVTARAPGFAPTPSLIAPFAPTREDWAELALPLEPCVRIRGVVRDQTGQPISGALIAQMHEPSDAWHPFGQVVPSPVHVDRADSGGRFDVCAHPRALISVAAEGYAWVGLSDHLPEHQVVLLPETTVRGWVVDDNGEPVASALVALDPIGAGTREPNPAAVSRTDGAFEIRGVPPGRYRVFRWRRGYRAESFVDVEAVVRPDRGRRPLVVSLRRCRATTTGSIEDHQGPVADAAVILSTDAVTTASPSSWATSDAAGRFVFDCDPTEWRGGTRRAAAIDYVKRASSGDGKGQPLHLEVDASPTVRGRVTLDGRPVHGAIVTDTPYASPINYRDHNVVRTRADGSFDLPFRRTPVRERLIATLPGVGRGYAELSAGVEDVRIEIDRRATLEISVVDSNNVPQSLNRVHVCGPGRPRDRYASNCPSAGRTDSDGRLVVGGLGRGEYTVWVQGSSAIDGERTVRIPGSGSATRFALDAFARSGTLAGRVVYEDGEPAAWARIAHPAGPRERPSYSRADAEGLFELSGLPASATYRLRAYSIEGTGGELPRVPAGTRDVVIEVPRPGAIAGTVENGCDGCVVRATPLDDCVPPRTPSLVTVARDDRFELRNVPPCSYSLGVERSKELRPALVTVVSNQTASAVIERQ